MPETFKKHFAEKPEEKLKSPEQIKEKRGLELSEILAKYLGTIKL